MQSNYRAAVAASLLILVGAAGIQKAVADAPPPDVFATANDTWGIEVAPYAWLPGLKGDATIRGYNTGIDQSFSDIFKTVKIAADGLMVARYNNWVVYGQLDFFNLNTTQLSDAPARGSFGTKELFYLAAGGYRFNGWWSGSSFDVMLGAQGIHLDNTLTLYQIGSVSRTNNVVDPVFILRPNFQFGQHWVINPTYSIGAGDGNKTYQLQTWVEYKFNATWDLRVGYRKMHYKFTGTGDRNYLNPDDNDYLNLNLQGPLIGFGATF
jgi:hypothetical protein